MTKYHKKFSTFILDERKRVLEPTRSSNQHNSSSHLKKHIRTAQSSFQLLLLVCFALSQQIFPSSPPSHLVKLSYSLIFEMDKTSCYAASIESSRARGNESRKNRRRRDEEIHWRMLCVVKTS